MLVKMNINGADYEAQEGEKILSLCLKVGIFVPHICYLKDHTPSGRCGLCVVDINNGTIALSCLTSVKDNMIIKTDSYTLNKIRKTNLTRILRTHTTNCFHCFKAGKCKLQRYITKIFEDSAENTTTISDIESKDIYTNITDHMLFNRSKCINCGRCVRFLTETCDMECKTVDVADYSSPQHDDLYGNIIDICPTAALKPCGNFEKSCNSSAIVSTTYDVSSVFTPKLQVTTVENRIIDISSIGGIWISNDIRFISSNYLQSYNNDIDLERLCEDIQSETLDKKVFLLGNCVDIETLFMVKYIADHYKSCIIVIDDINISQSNISNLGISIQEISNVDYAVFVGINKASEILYIKNSLRELKKSIEIDNISSISDLSGYKKPYLFISPDSFRTTPNLPFSIIPKDCTQMFTKVLQNYIPLAQFEQIYNRHDVKFVCTLGKSTYSPKDGMTFFKVEGKHFLSDSSYYINVFNKIVQTKQTICYNNQSTKEVLWRLLRLLFSDKANDVFQEIHVEMKNLFRSLS